MEEEKLKRMLQEEEKLNKWYEKVHRVWPVIIENFAKRGRMERNEKMQDFAHWISKEQLNLDDTLFHVWGLNKQLLHNLKGLEEENERLKKENARLEEENERLEEENSQLKEENARLEEENVGLEQTQEEEQTPLMEYEALIEKITPWFGQDKEAASDFIRHCIGVDPTYITKMAGELWAEDILDDHHVHKRLWEALKEAGLYNYSLNNWNAQVGKAAQAKD